MTLEVDYLQRIQNGDTDIRNNLRLYCRGGTVFHRKVLIVLGWFQCPNFQLYNSGSLICFDVPILLEL